MKYYEEENGLRTIENNRSNFVWHQDEFDRMFRLISGEDWFLQIENELPQRINNQETMFVSKKTWHRVLCLNNEENNPLIITILDFKDNK